MKTAIFICVLMCLAYSQAQSQRKERMYRTDYEYNKRTDAYYKLHIESTVNMHAKEVCAMEGASLMIPDNKEDISQLHGMLKQFPDLGNYVWVSTDGHKHDAAEVSPIIELTPTSEERDSFAAGLLECDVVTRSGEIETMGCYRSYPFFCKVSSKDLVYNQQCNIYSPGYVFVESVHSCYRVPDVAATWDEAYSECRAEGSHLVVINSDAERLAVKEFLKTAPKPIRARENYFYHAGFRADRAANGTDRVFKTIFNETLVEAGFERWSDGEPNNYRGIEHCGTIYSNNGLFNDIECSRFYAFICEIEVPSQSNAS